MVICLEQGADLHMAQLMPLPLTVSCFSEIQIGFTFLVPAHPGSPGKRAVKRVCVAVLILNVVCCRCVLLKHWSMDLKTSCSSVVQVVTVMQIESITSAFLRLFQS